MDKNKELNNLLNVVTSINNSENYEVFMEENDIDLQEIFWAAEYYLKEYKNKLEKEV